MCGLLESRSESGEQRGTRTLGVDAEGAAGRQFHAHRGESNASSLSARGSDGGLPRGDARRVVLVELLERSHGAHVARDIAALLNVPGLHGVGRVAPVAHDAPTGQASHAV